MLEYRNDTLTGAAACVQGAAVAFTSLCEAVVSWQHIRHEGLRTKITRIMQMYKAKLVRCVSRCRPVPALLPSVLDDAMLICHCA